MDLGDTATPSADVLQAIATQTNPRVPYPVVFAVAERESTFDPLATGAAGELGLMQILPSTARSVGYIGPVDALLEAPVNVQVGTAYLAKLFDQYHTWPEAIRAYNGSGAAARAYSVGVLQRVPFWSDFVKANAAVFAAVTSKRTVQWGLIVAAALGALFLLAQLRRRRRVEA